MTLARTIPILLVAAALCSSLQSAAHAAGLYRCGDGAVTYAIAACPGDDSRPMAVDRVTADDSKIPGARASAPSGHRLTARERDGALRPAPPASAGARGPLITSPRAAMEEPSLRAPAGVDPVTGRVLAPAGEGLVDPLTGTRWLPVGAAYVDPLTGRMIPAPWVPAP